MHSSLATASRRTHLKVVVTSLVMGIVVMLVGMTARIVDTGSTTGRPRWLPPPKQAEVVAVVQDSIAPEIPCKQQTWPSVDRQCLPWTAMADAPHDGHADPPAAIARLPGVRSARKDQMRPGAVPSPMNVAAQLPSAAKVRRVKQAHDAKVRVARHARNERVARYVNDDLSDVPMSSFGAASRRGVVRPTNPQDAYYYSWRSSQRSSDLFGFLHQR